jgi:radical SAM protein with 4Fe4S-binding SPASM domain
LARRSINAAKGHCFIAYNGDVCPSGFLPIPVGNVRTTPLHELYRQAPLFQALRDPERLKGKCGACEFRALCGGSRARAYAVTGDPLAAEPCCAYQPRACTRASSSAR